MFATNVTGLVNMTQEILQDMLQRNKGAGAGDIINIGSIAGVSGGSAVLQDVLKGSLERTLRDVPGGEEVLLC